MKECENFPLRKTIMSRDEHINMVEARLNFRDFLMHFEIYGKDCLQKWHDTQFFTYWRAHKEDSFCACLVRMKIIPDDFRYIKDDDSRYAQCGLPLYVPIFNMFEDETPTRVAMKTDLLKQQA